MQAPPPHSLKQAPITSNGGSANAPKAEQSRAKALPVPFWEQRTYTVPLSGYCRAPLQGAYAASRFLLRKNGSTSRRYLAVTIGGTLAAQCACENIAERCSCQNHKAKTLKPYWLKQKSNREGAYYRNILNEYQHH